METIHPNIAVLQQFDPSDVSASINIIANDAIFHYYNPMLQDLQGDYHGKKGFMEFFGKIGGKTKGTFKVTPLSITPMGNELVVTHVKNEMVLEHNTIEVDAVVVWRIVNGKIREAWDIPAVYTAQSTIISS